MHYATRDATGMFQHAWKFNQDLATWRVSALANAASMLHTMCHGKRPHICFCGAHLLGLCTAYCPKSYFHPVAQQAVKLEGQWPVQNMFDGAAKFKQPASIKHLEAYKQATNEKAQMRLCTHTFAQMFPAENANILEVRGLSVQER